MYSLVHRFGCAPSILSSCYEALMADLWSVILPWSPYVSASSDTPIHLVQLKQLTGCDFRLDHSSTLNILCFSGTQQHIQLVFRIILKSPLL